MRELLLSGLDDITLILKNGLVSVSAKINANTMSRVRFDSS